ncbi:MAG TPA: HNH endonuclease [Anaerolineae bacterium]|nr:HNH endonuclease [Anaerolineae bacterium]
MSPRIVTDGLKTTFYPMAGSLEDYFPNLLETLRWIDVNNPRPRQVHAWLETRFDLSNYFARDVYSVLLKSSKLVEVSDVNGTCSLTLAGKTVVQSASPEALLEVFSKSFAGVAVVLEILHNQPYLTAEKLTLAWFEIVKERFTSMAKWSKRTLGNQLRHRLDWLRALGFVNLKNSQYVLSENGWQFISEHPPEAIAIQPKEIEQEEKQIEQLVLNEFQPFDTAGRTKTLRQVYVRDRTFRIVVSAQYNYCCAICGFRLRAPRGVYEAEAAHIIPKRSSGTDDPRNGICLCSTCHWAFDEGVLSVNAADRKILVASYLFNAKADVAVARYIKVRGNGLRDVLQESHRPSNEALQWHNDKIFLG